MLQAFGMRAVVFVAPEALEDGKLDLVSIHRLHQMIASGVWEVGVTGCRHFSEEGGEEPFYSVDRYRAARAKLAAWTERPVSAVNCERPWAEVSTALERWRSGLDEASLQLGFILAPPGANYRDDRPYGLRVVRVPKQALDADTFITQLDALAPRRGPFVDEFRGDAPAPDWIADPDSLAYETKADRHLLRVAPKAGKSGALVLLSGTERWRDARLTVDVEDVDGQFWIEQRRDDRPGFVRLGISDGKAVLQKSGADGKTRQFASRPVKPPVRLQLDVIGSRAVALVDGRPLGRRAVSVPRGVSRGSVALAVWSEDGHASTKIRRVEAAPLPRSAAIVPAELADSSWDQLRSEIGRLWAVSPRSFSWRAGRSGEPEPPSGALRIFAKHNLVALMPAVVLESWPRAAEWQDLGEDLSKWSSEASYDGLNLVVEARASKVLEAKAEIERLRERLAKEGKELVVTIVAKPDTIPPELDDLGEVFATSNVFDAFALAQARLTFRGEDPVVAESEAPEPTAMNATSSALPR
jgi:peptidoglycan/xylan/chitin deacetylase (PgdA/CDA1 family)